MNARAGSASFGGAAGPFAADLELALGAVAAAGDAVMSAFGGAHEVVHKGPDQPLTASDLAADRVLRERLTGARPGYGWLSEETADSPDRLGADRVWIVDPIDGTRSFIAGRPEFAISVGLVARGEPMIGVVSNPARAEVYWAVRGGGAYRDGRRLAVTSRKGLDGASLLASRSELAAGEFTGFGGGLRIEPTGSTAYKLARVAAGEADAFVSRGPKSEWDVCAGELLVREAGGLATDLEGSAFAYNRADPRVYGVVATNGLLHEAVLAVVERLEPPSRLTKQFPARRRADDDSGGRPV